MASALRHPAKGGHDGGRGGHGLHPWRDVQHHDAFATSGAGINFTKSGTATNPINYFAYQAEIPVFDFTNMVISDHRLHARVRWINASYLHFQGAPEIRYVPMNNLLQQRRGGDRRRRRHLRAAAEHAPQQRQRDLHRQQDGGGSPDPQLRRPLTTTMRCVVAGAGTERRTAFVRPLPDDPAPPRSCPGCQLVVELRRRLRSDQPRGIPVTVENSSGVRQRLRQCTAPSTRPTETGTASRWGAARPAFATWFRSQRRLKNKASGFYANYSTGGNTEGTTTPRSVNGYHIQHVGEPGRDAGTSTITLTGSLVCTSCGTTSARTGPTRTPT